MVFLTLSSGCFNWWYYVSGGCPGQLSGYGRHHAMNLFGHGIALYTGIVIQGASSITGGYAGFGGPVSIMNAIIPLIIVMRLVTTITVFIMIKKDMEKNLGQIKLDQAALDVRENVELDKTSYFLAIVNSSGMWAGRGLHAACV